MVHIPKLLLSIIPFCAPSLARTSPNSHALNQQDVYRKQACPDYKDYSQRRHGPYTTGEYSIPYQRPSENCRLFRSEAVERVIEEYGQKLSSPYLARLFENCFPNTLDTTIRWHVNGPAESAQSFIVTGDINAQWLRDSTSQLQQYQHLAKEDKSIKSLLLGAINTQAEFVLESPYCNAFQPPPGANLPPTSNGQRDVVHPTYDPDRVFECKWEIDSLASFLKLANEYYANTKDSSFVTPRWLRAIQTTLVVLEEQSVGTFLANDQPADMVYTFQRQTTLATETLSLNGIGNPIAANTSLVRSSFRPSDDSTILQLFIPGNAFMSVELLRLADTLQDINYKKHHTLINNLRSKGNSIRDGIYEHGVVHHKLYGKVFAFEVDGYGSHTILDDANIPSLLSLPLLGFVKHDDPIYLNTRKMVLSQKSNPYFLQGRAFYGIGGPHIGIRNAWPISLLAAIMTSDDDKEIMANLNAVLKVSANLGLIHESVNVEKSREYTRSWFAWANSLYAQCIMDLAKRKPHLVFGPKPRGYPSRKEVEEPGAESPATTEELKD